SPAVTAHPPSVIFLVAPDGAPRHRRSFPTRRSSDLAAGAAGGLGQRTRARPARARWIRAGSGMAWRPDRARHDPVAARRRVSPRSEEHTAELQSRENLVCRLLLAKKTEARSL